MTTRRVGIIDNLEDLHSFVDNRYERASATEIMSATGGNTGNVAFVYAARKVVGNPMTRVSWGTSHEEVRANCDHLIICCANQIGKHVDLGVWADRLEKFGLPVSLLGLGAQSESNTVFPEIPEGTKKFLSVVNALRFQGVDNIAVRGDFTQAVLANEKISAIPTGCPSLHISPIKNLGESILKRQAQTTGEAAVVVAAGNPWHQRSAKLEQILVDIVEQAKGIYVLQHPESMFQFALGESVKETTLNHFLEIYGNGFTEHSLREWYRRNAAFFIDAPNWMRALSRFDRVVGPRYHGVALGIQAGIPGAVVTIDSRTEELCTGTGIPRIDISEALKMNANELCEAALWTDEDAVEFDRNRKIKATMLKEFIVANGLEPSSHFSKLS
ncbi:polysaccharide pyruvyl transferase family protein [Massilia oculi]|uniref:polysaccharide pyruvyl transferase family protein n=1 Tax=Massilia oculi TaxID=945844 RepID=UPI0028A81489|nr:polysaccharide pyruvyl transferase family protein [Massilia oculi]